jgi:hypothetical protein
VPILPEVISTENAIEEEKVNPGSQKGCEKITI